MTRAEQVDAFLDEAGTFDFLTIEDGRPRGRVFGFHLLDGDRIYFGCGTFKEVYHQMEKNPYVEILAFKGNRFLRYDGKVRFVQDERLLKRTREILPAVMALYDRDGHTMGLFTLEEGHAEIHDMMRTVESFDL